MSAAIRMSLFLIVAVPALAIAGGKATLQAASGTGHATTIHIEWQNSRTLRMQTDGGPSYFIARDGKAYSVTMNDGRPMVMDMASMMSMMRGAPKGGAVGAKAPAFADPGSFEATGATETVAGVKGDVYRMQWTDAHGKHKTQDVVLTDDPTVVEMTRAYFGSVSSMFGNSDASRFQDKMPGNDQGLLRVGDQFRVESISHENPADSRFKLPAKPMSLQQMMRGG
jgi:hypothetical protein